MTAFYDFITGPLLWVTFALFVGGSIYKIVGFYIQAKKKDIQVVEHWNWKYVLRSWAVWIVPFSTVRWRTDPVLTVATFAFHICLFLVPIFLSGHLIMLEQSWDFSWWSMPGWLADTGTVIVLAVCVYFLIRRLFFPTVRFVTYPSDYVILGIVAGTFLFGILAYYQVWDYELMMIAHVLFGEAFLVMIPFTRASHMLLGPIVRGHAGSEFGGVRKVQDW